MYNDTENRFVLERYCSGGSNRYVCPQCGRKKCFTRYVDLETGNMWLMNVVNAIIRHRVAIIILRVNISMIIRSLAARKITRRNM